MVYCIFRRVLISLILTLKANGENAEVINNDYLVYFDQRRQNAISTKALVNAMARKDIPELELV